ncbi:MAG: ABC transporter permease [Ruminococcaceae bacterium]|nr:ABC transporter permease [Oscillospiraceae bacterium]
MYIIKNAVRCISRSKGRNILIGIIVLVISVSACLGLSIRQAAESAKENTLAELNITATISYDRSSMMNDMMGGEKGQGGGFDRDQFKDMMGNASSLTLEEYQTYADAESVQDFYYTLTTAFNGNDDLEPVTDETEDEESESNSNLGGFGGGKGFPGGDRGGKGMLSSSDFSVIGYSSDSSMTAFIDGTASVLEGGTMFEEGTTEKECVISEELAIFNELSVGDTIILTNPSVETETYELKIVGLYTSSANNDFSMSMFGKSQDPANQIYMSAASLQTILDASDEVSTTITDENTGRESDSAVTGSIAAAYVFANTDKYYAFEEEVRTLGLDDSYAVSSPDLAAFENSLTPLNTLSTMAGWFLVVILIIGAIILIVLNIFNVRERKYEVGVLTAMGMKKWKVATQFMCEILVVTMIAVIIGAGIGAVSSVPVTNALLAGQVESQNSQQTQMEENFGRPGDFGGGFPNGNIGSMPGATPSDAPDDMDGGRKNPFENMLSGAENYITEVNSAMNLTVVFQMLGVGLLLTLVASMASVTFIMRYDPLKILANRD